MPNTTPATTDATLPASQQKRPVLARLGAPVVAAYRDTRDLMSLFVDTFIAIVRGRASTRTVFAQCFEIGNRSVPFVVITLGVLGFITVYQVANQVAQILPDFSMLGAAFIQMMCREFAPTITEIGRASCGERV